MKASPIPSGVRHLVKTREIERCFRCGSPLRQGQGHWHHRRSRSVRDEHMHCACNGVFLCGTCHTWVHAHPFEARGLGLIVTRHESEPASVPATAFFGVVYLNCKGTYRYQRKEEEESG